MLLLDFSRFGGKNKVISRKCCKSSAFTLAEVLITLGIIGVVAAMTMPTLINKYQEKATVTKIKKMYSVLSQAVLFVRAEHGEIESWNLPNCGNGGSQIFYSYLKPYLKISKECLKNNNNKCYPEQVSYTYLNGNYWATATTGYANSANYVRFLLSDGSLIWLRVNNSSADWCKESDTWSIPYCGIIWYDINGKNAPNRMGKDVFLFLLTPRGVVPHSGLGEDSCYLSGLGWSCSKWIIEHDNMDYPAVKQAE